MIQSFATPFVVRRVNNSSTKTRFHGCYEKFVLINCAFFDSLLLSV